ncbi:MAG: DNA repair protein RecN [Actinobacteria bacterium]|nr:DNA repair protein RecN [Actinomycetota bacterium]
MLVSLVIRNFVLIEDAEMRFGPGLTVLTGETGAGKTLLTRALGLLVGERAEEGLVGLAADDAWVQAVIDVDPVALADIPEEVRDLVSLEPGEAIVTRRLNRQGRNRCFVNDAAITLASMGEIVGRLLSFSGQHEYRRLLDPAYQLAVLDEWSGPEVIELAAKVAAAHQQAQATEMRLHEMRRTREARLREIDFLHFQVKELSEAALSVDEEGQLLIEQRRLARAEDLLKSTGAAADLLSGGDAGADVSSLLAQAVTHLAAINSVDDSIDAVASGLAEAQYLISELSRELHGLLDAIAVDPARLQVVDERLRQYTDIARKYGGSTEAALAYLESSVEDLDDLERTEEDLTTLEHDRETHVATALELAEELSRRRRESGPLLEQAVVDQLADLGMPEARIVVRVDPREGWEGLRSSGSESVEFLLAANPGQPPRSLARTASGGELSRVLLALKCALAGVGGNETLILDEIDAGIGGRTGAAVAGKIRDLASSSQVIVVTHLAQVAALADRNYVVDKKISDQGPAVIHLSLVEDEAIVRELCRMMGGHPEDSEAMAHARQLRERAVVSRLSG